MKSSKDDKKQPKPDTANTKKKEKSKSVVKSKKELKEANDKNA